MTHIHIIGKPALVYCTCVDVLIPCTHESVCFPSCIELFVHYFCRSETQRKRYGCTTTPPQREIVTIMWLAIKGFCVQLPFAVMLLLCYWLYAVRMCTLAPLSAACMWYCTMSTMTRLQSDLLCLSANSCVIAHQRLWEQSTCLVNFSNMMCDVMALYKYDNAVSGLSHFRQPKTPKHFL